MKVLISAQPVPETYVAYLADSLVAKGIDVKCSVGGFFEPDTAIDVLHIHWPEALCGWREPSAGQMERIKTTLEGWRALDRPVVITRHNSVSHAHRSARSRALYDSVLSAASGIVHLGAASLAETSHLFPCPQLVIPHGNWPDAKPVARFAARLTLGIQADEFVVLAFGAIRHLEEKRLILGTFRRLSVRPKTLVVPRWREATQPSWRHDPLGRIRAHLLDRAANREMRVDDGLVAPEQIGSFFGAANVVFIPRLDTLNSGVLHMAYSHGRAVVGPRTGNLTEILEATENPSYQPGDPNSAAEAIAAAANEDLDALGEANRRYALEHWDWSRIAGRHLDLYAEIQALVPGPLLRKRSAGQARGIRRTRQRVEALTPPSRNRPGEPMNTPCRAGAGHLVLLTPGYPPARQTVPRSVGFAKYLGAVGWSASVITPSAPAAAGASFFEAPEGVNVRRTAAVPTIATLVAATLRVARRVRTRSLEEGTHRSGGRTSQAALLRSLLRWTETPDHLVGWIPTAAFVAGRVLRATRPSVVCASGPPFSVVLAGAIAARLTGSPFIADFRDTWCLDESDPFGTIGGRFRARPSGTRCRLLRLLERWCLEKADAVMFTSTQTLIGYQECYPFLRSKATVVFNGADPDDFVGDVGPTVPPIIAHIGTIHDFQADQFLALLRALVLMRDRGQLEGARFVQAGAIGETLRSWIEDRIQEFSLAQICEVRDYLPHNEAVRLMRASSVLVLLAGRNRFIRLSKLSEYIAAGRPLLALAEDDSETAVAARAYGAKTIGNWSPQNVAAGILEALRTPLASLEEHAASVLLHPHPLNRITAAQQLGRIAEDVVRRSQRSRRVF